jgi:hypothetical protein
MIEGELSFLLTYGVSNVKSANLLTTDIYWGIIIGVGLSYLVYPTTITDFNDFKDDNSEHGVSPLDSSLLSTKLFTLIEIFFLGLPRFLFSTFASDNYSDTFTTIGYSFGLFFEPLGLPLPLGCNECSSLMILIESSDFTSSMTSYTETFFLTISFYGIEI